MNDSFSSQNLADAPAPDEFARRMAAGQNLLSSGSPERAIEQFRGALSIEPDVPLPHALLALALSECGRYEAARHEANLALQMRPDEAFFHHVAGAIAVDSGNPREGLPRLQEAVALDPDEADYHAALAGAFNHLSRRQESEASARTALALDPENADAHVHLGFALIHQNRRGEARAHFERALQLAPQDGVTHHGMSMWALKTGDKKRAVEHIREALRLDPENSAFKEAFIATMGAKNPLLALFWKWSLALDGWPDWARIGVILGLWAGVQVLKAIGRAVPSLQPFIWPIVGLYVAFCLYSWIAPALFRWWLRRSHQI